MYAKQTFGHTELLLRETLVDKGDVGNMEGQADGLGQPRNVKVRQLQERLRLALRQSEGVVGTSSTHTYTKVVLGHEGLGGNLALVRRDVRELVKVVRGHPVDLGRPDGISAQIRNAQRVADNEARRALGQAGIDAREPRVPWSLGDLREDVRTLGWVGLGIRRGTVRC